MRVRRCIETTPATPFAPGIGDRVKPTMSGEFLLEAYYGDDDATPDHGCEAG